MPSKRVQLVKFIHVYGRCRCCRPCWTSGSCKCWLAHSVIDMGIEYYGRRNVRVDLQAFVLHAQAGRHLRKKHAGVAVGKSKGGTATTRFTLNISGQSPVSGKSDS